jgi:ribosomal protein S18 acetylase RimI-like enzyme
VNADRPIPTTPPVVPTLPASDPRVARYMDRDPLAHLSLRGTIDGHDADRTGPLTVWVDDGGADVPGAMMVGTYRGFLLSATSVAAAGRVLAAIAGQPWQGDDDTWRLRGVSAELAPAVEARFEILRTMELLHYVLPPDAATRKPLVDDGAESVDPADAATIGLIAGLSSRGDTDYVTRRAAAGPSVVVRDEATGEPLSWAMTRDDGQMGLMWTQPAARGRGLARRVTATLAARIIADGSTPFLYTESTNTPARRTAESLGFVAHRDTRWYRLRPLPGGGSTRI